MILVRAHNAAFGLTQRLLGDWFLGTIARLVFAGVLFNYFWTSAMTKLGDGITGLWTLQPGAYVQILPTRFEAVGYDPAALTFSETATVYAGTYGEVLIPILIVAGLFTRLASLGMIVFIVVMTFVDVTGHGVDAATMGAWFDRSPEGVYDQRSLWAFLLLVLVVKGPGPISLDALFGRWARR